MIGEHRRTHRARGGALSKQQPFSFKVELDVVAQEDKVSSADRAFFERWAADSDAIKICTHNVLRKYQIRSGLEGDLESELKSDVARFFIRDGQIESRIQLASA
jgi:hypothetical protein